MSEYQYVEFRAVDKPLTDSQLKFAEKQSTRAEISRWSFRNEYHYGDFHGDVNGLLRRGYDVFLHYANFGIRTVAFRLPAGFPFPKRLWSRYIGTGELQRPTDDEQCREWIKRLSEAGSRDLLHRFLTDDPNTVKVEVNAAIRQEGESYAWPTLSLGRSLQTLLDRTEQIRADYEAKEEEKRAAAAKREAAKQERKRQERMKKMANDPPAWLREVSRLVDAGGTANYLAAAETLTDLREAIGGIEGEKITRKHAAHLVRKHPTLTRLKGSLRKNGLLE